MKGITVELLDYMGDDLDVVNAAKVSFSKESEWEVTDNKGIVSRCNMPGDTRLPGNQSIQCRCTQLFMTKRRYDRIQAAKQ